MPFTESQKLDIGVILGVDQVALEDRLTYNSVRITDAVITKVGTLITTWTGGAGSKTTKIHPNTANKGVETDPEATRQQIRRDIANLLFCSDLLSGGGMTSTFLRG